MSKYYVLSHDAGGEDLEAVVDYEMGDFNLTTFWYGGEIEGEIPSEVRLWVGKGQPTDYMGNPLSWPIVSERLWAVIGDLVAPSCQLVKVPLYYEGTSDSVDGFWLMNVTASISAVRATESHENLSISSLVIDENCIPVDTHAFRLAESSTLIIVSDDVRKRISGKELQGIALIELQR